MIESTLAMDCLFNQFEHALIKPAGMSRHEGLSILAIQKIGNYEGRTCSLNLQSRIREAILCSGQIANVRVSWRRHVSTDINIESMFHNVVKCDGEKILN